MEGPAGGTYILLIELPRDCEIAVGALGPLSFPRGFYAYVGSAMGGLEARIRRHLRKRKRFHWHIDFLLQRARVREVISIRGKKVECPLARELEQTFPCIPRFGSSDCRCKSHLFFCRDYRLLREKILKLSKGQPWDSRMEKGFTS
ncbi:MAG: GIY-YIG nuclease family protein [Deltaproteobacteria bacterium]|nr:MAG: GIY-YIG nuclease family protein [Deltaproteobacteria bacterium]